MQSQVTKGLVPSWFTPENQNLPEEQQHSYQWKPMDGWECIDISNQFLGGKLTPIGIKKVLNTGLIGWKNIKDKSTGEFVEFDNLLVGHAPTNELIDLAYEILASSYLTEEEEKN